MAVSAVAWQEALFGVARMASGMRKAKLESYLKDVAQTIPILSYDGHCAVWQAEEVARLEAKGINVPRADEQIAAVAIVNKLTLVTANVRDFRHFKELTVENWIA